MAPIRTVRAGHFLLPIVLAAGLGGCAKQIAPEADHRIQFQPGPPFVADDELAASFGGSVKSIYQIDRDGETSRVIVSFDERREEPRFASLNDFAAWVDTTFREARPGRTLTILSVDQIAPLIDAGFPFVILAYGQTPPAGNERWSSICDAAALLIECPDGFWTVSWNSARGTLGDSREVLRAFLDGMTLQPIDSEPVSLDQSSR